MKTMISYGIKRFVIGGLAGGCLALASAAPAFAGSRRRNRGLVRRSSPIRCNVSSGVRAFDSSGRRLCSAALRENIGKSTILLRTERFPTRISVTHTGPVGDRIEIGILPYEEAHASFSSAYSAASR